MTCNYSEFLFLNLPNYTLKLPNYTQPLYTHFIWNTFENRSCHVISQFDRRSLTVETRWLFAPRSTAYSLVSGCSITTSASSNGATTIDDRHTGADGRKPSGCQL